MINQNQTGRLLRHHGLSMHLAPYVTNYIIYPVLQYINNEGKKNYIDKLCAEPSSIYFLNIHLCSVYTIIAFEYIINISELRLTFKTYINTIRVRVRYNAI